jgi:hypothetical protein
MVLKMVLIGSVGSQINIVSSEVKRRSAAYPGAEDFFLTMAASENE